MNIGFYRAGLIGDNVVALHAIYAIKCLYPQSHLTVYTNTFGINLYSQFYFIDALVNVDSLCDEQLTEDITMRGFTCFILTQPNRAKCKLLMRTNVKRIVTFRTLWNLTRVRFETIFISRNLSNIPQYQRILRLVWKIDPAHYKANFKFIDFSAIRLASQESNKVTISQFLAAHNIQSPLVIVNPFVRSTHCNLSIDGYCLLIRRLASSYPQIGIVIPTYKDNVDISLSLRDLHNVAIFCNDSDLLNIVALLESSSLLISPSTGISHIANNLRIPMVWLCSKRDRHLWMGDAMNPEFFVMLKQPTGKMSKQVEEHYISLVMKKFSVLIETFLNRS